MKIVLIQLYVVLLFSKSHCEDRNLNEPNNDTLSSFYTAAVIEFNSPDEKFKSPHEIVEANLAEYIRWIDEASEKGVDILVFSEAALNYNGIDSRKELAEVAVELQTDVPDISECDYSHNTILSDLSFAAANASIYVLVNVVEMETCNDSEACSSDGFKLYNTNLVFDRNGCIISRYRKINLFVEPLMDVVKEPEITTFDTDFGVTFGHFVCFDILFKSPAMDLINMNISHILYPSMWFSEVPFLTSVQIQQSFAERNNIALLSSGTNRPSNSNTGSGIFVGNHGAVDKIISCRNETQMIIAEIPKDLNDPDYEPSPPTIHPYTPVEMDATAFWNFTSKQTYPLHKHFASTIGDVTCDMVINFTRLEIPEGSVGYSYRLAVFSGVRNYADIVDAGEIHCAIIPCVDPKDEDTCGHRIADSTNLVPSVSFHSIEATLTIDNDDENFLVMPTTLDVSTLPLAIKSYNFEHQIENGEQKYVIKSTKELNNLMTFGIFARNFNLDRHIPHISEAKDSSLREEEEEDEQISLQNEESDEFFSDDDEDDDLRLKMTIYVVLMVVLSVITAFMVHRKLQHPYVKPDSNKRKSCT